MEIWIAITDHANGRDVEVLDDKPARTFIEGLLDAMAEKRIDRCEIRVANVNGGDSQTLFSADHNPDEWYANDPDLIPWQ